ncbi:DHA2 family efflux MFS transporter permease subunit [Pedobacter hartonius]|uniref:MFS transporter, DHA2 family, multidrug resistance protein n=1 Tax=Pedobacter hartonius TaxID=425514 RepID=A0A1H3VYW8_9SPHI|nr:DHA2 family efflux MFS transporter permease subunit [Pedobacter hartonius]SDZ80013.1 MFS transporter, DHA2 family, multidrug resistance protein [Pedobacter hartonius]
METGFKKWVIVATIIVAAIIELIDTTIVNVSINTMSGNLGASLEDTAWVITSYAIANVIVIPMTSFLAEKIGRKSYYIGSILLFTLASLFCGLSTNLWMLVFFRFLQGVGGGALLSTSQSILYDTFPPNQRALASGIFSLGIIIGPSIGPVMGGYIVDNLSWQDIFYVNIPIGLTAAFLSYLYLKPSKPANDGRRIDWLGIALLTAGIGSLQIVLERGQTDDWFGANYIIVLSLIAVVCITLLVWWELRISNPIINLRVLKSRTLAISAILTFILGFGLFSNLFVFPLFSQRLIGYSAFQTGMMLLPGTLIAASISPFLGKMMQSGVKPQYLAFGGFLLSALFGLLISKANLETGSDFFMIPLLLRGPGASLLVVPLTALAVSDLKPADIPQGAALNNMMRQMGGSFGIALINTYIAHRAAYNRNALITHVTSSDALTAQRMQLYTRNFMDHGSTYLEATKKALIVLESTIVRQTTLMSYMNAFLLIAVLNACCIPLVLITIRKKRADRPAGTVTVSDH